MYQSKLNFSLPKSDSGSLEKNSINNKSIVGKALNEFDRSELSSSIDQSSYSPMTFRSSLNSNVPSPNLIERSDDFNILSLNKNNEENLEESSTSNNLSESCSQIFNPSKNFNSNFSTPKSLVLIPYQPVTVKEIRDKDNRCFQTTCDLKKFTTNNLNANYLSPEIQNELLEIIGKQIKTEIIEEIKRNRIFSLILDGTSDICDDEQISVCFRFLQNTTGESLYELVCSIFSSNGLNLKNLVGQCYYGASNMSGEFKGLASRIKADSPGALYVHCYAHRLNLALQDSFNALKAVNDNYMVILETLQEINRSDRNTLANSIYLSFFTFDFIFYLDILTNFFKITNILWNKLQEIDLDYMNIKELAQTTIFALNDYKKEAIFDGFWSKTLKTCDELEISLPQSPRKRKKPTFR
ncbi:unnamed protein product [Brachionus calyciflorus]|uniref:DUF4371 domain-containing protein n=1 Tax=Brachionus calyciflorus TaxID=104777 RepID=A0A814B2H0_9BILA|nr:unnamed protein product [Brachionus calyciflorus]